MDLGNKVAVITGAFSGIGEATVRAFLEGGAKVVAVDVNPRLPEVFDGLEPDRLRCVVGDVATEATNTAMAEMAVKSFGRIDVMVCNAGIALIRAIADITSDEWDRVMNVNVKSIYWAARAVVPVMRAQGGGVFLLTGSISSICGLDHQGVYGPSKGAVIQIARQMAVDYARDGIRVNAVCPGTVDTPLLQTAAVDSGDAEGFLHGLAASHPIGRIAAPRKSRVFSSSWRPTTHVFSPARC